MDEKKKRTIEEIAKIIYKDFQATSRYIAEQIYNAGYRKESDTARGILTNIYDICIDQGFLDYNSWRDLWEKYVGD